MGRLRMVVMFFGAALAALSASGCELAMIGGASTLRQSGLSDTVPLMVPPEAAARAVAEVGRSLGYSVNYVDLNQGSVTLSKSDPFVGQFVGVMHSTTIATSSVDRGKNLKLSVNVTGSYGRGGENEVAERLEEFKAKLLETLGSLHISRQ